MPKPHFVIAHSHAGNIALSAARYPEINERLTGIVTLSTPFIIARRRNLGWAGTVVSQSMVLWIVLGLFWFFNEWLGPLFGVAPDGQLSDPFKIGLMLGLALIVEVSALLSTSRWRRHTEELLNSLTLAPFERQRILIIRSMADEASGFITLAQFFSTIATFVFGHFAAYTDGYVRWSAKRAERPVLAILICVLFWIASLLPVYFVLWLTASKLLMWISLIVLTCLSYGPIVFHLLRNRQLALITAAGCLALPLAPALIVIALANWIAYGPRFAKASLDLDISVESTPVGEYLLNLIAPVAAADLDRPGGLLHSKLYDDENAINMITAFIADRLCEVSKADR